MKILRFIVGALALVAAASASAQQRIAIADPHHAHLVEGRVLLADGRPAVGVLVERAETATGAQPYNRGFYSDTTDAAGHFRIHFSGLGFGSGLVWYLAVRRPNCPVTVTTVTLENARMPPPDDYWEGDVRTGIVIRLPPCPARTTAPPADRRRTHRRHAP